MGPIFLKNNYTIDSSTQLHSSDTAVQASGHGHVNGVPKVFHMGEAETRADVLLLIKEQPTHYMDARCEIFIQGSDTENFMMYTILPSCFIVGPEPLSAHDDDRGKYLTGPYHGDYDNPGAISDIPITGEYIFPIINRVGARTFPYIRVYFDVRKCMDEGEIVPNSFKMVLDMFLI